MSTLVLVRHGETPWNAERRLQGAQDIELSDVGRSQATALRDLVRGLAPTRVVASPLLRARDTLRLIGLDPDEVDPRWQEADLGEWTGRRSADLDAADYAEWRAGRLTPPGGESLSAVHTRVADALRDVPEVGTTLVVTHGGPIRAACTVLVGLPSSHLVPVLPGSVSTFELSGTPRLMSFNVTPSPTLLRQDEQAD